MEASFKANEHQQFRSRAFKAVFLRPSAISQEIVNLFHILYMKNLSEALLPQPRSFSKKKNYVLYEILGTGAFGKVMVSISSDFLSIMLFMMYDHSP